jgi:hypothetical protein
MILSIHQPSYFPWLGLLHKIANSDVFMMMDDVQLSDSGFQNRNSFLSADGKVKFLTIPINRKNYLRRPLRDLEISDPSWKVKHLNFILSNYRRHRYFDEILPLLADYYAEDYPRLIDALIASMRISIELFGIGTKMMFQSEVPYDKSLHRGQLVLDLVRKAGADRYLSGVGANAYLDPSDFADNPSLKYDVFAHPTYPQKNARDFVPGLSCLDVLFNLGTEGARTLLQRTRQIQ